VVVVVIGVAFVVVGGVVEVVAGSTLVVVSRADVVVGNILVAVVSADIVITSVLEVVVDVDDFEQPMPVTSRDNSISVIIASLKGLFILGFPISTRSEPTLYLFELDIDNIPRASSCKAE